MASAMLVGQLPFSSCCPETESERPEADRLARNGDMSSRHDPSKVVLVERCFQTRPGGIPPVVFDREARL